MGAPRQALDIVGTSDKLSCCRVPGTRHGTQAKRRFEWRHRISLPRWPP